MSNRRPFPISVIIGCFVFAAGCGSSASNPLTPATPSAATSASFGLAPGYPKRVAISSLDRSVGFLLKVRGATEALILAPGVYTALPPGTTVADAALGGSLNGTCGPVKAFVAAHPDQTHSYGCNN
jgi:hypothetical protein